MSRRRQFRNRVDRGAIQPLSPPPTSYQSLSVIAPDAVRVAMADGRVILLGAVGVVREIVVQGRRGRTARSAGYPLWTTSCRRRE